MSLLSKLESGSRLYDRLTDHERLIDKVEHHGQVVFLSFKHPQTGAIDRQPFSISELENRFEILDEGAIAFRAQPEIVSLVAEAHRLRHAYLFNPLFATETSLIDLLPHQLAAVYGVPPTSKDSLGQLGMLDAPRLRFLLADDAGAGKTIMAGLLVREMLLRRAIGRVLVVPPAGLVGNWERELRVLFRLRFRILSSADVSDDYNPFADPRNALVIISVDTLWREKTRQAYETAPPYDLVIFDEAHKLGARLNNDFTIDRTHRYRMAEFIARRGRHLLLMTATPHMGKDDPYYLLWRLLEPELFSTQEAFQRLDKSRKRNYLLRRMKEEMVSFDGKRIFPPRDSKTVEYPLRQGIGQEQDLYNQVTEYCQTHYDLAKLRNRSAAGLAMSILQRRLASSTWAVLKSLERRQEKLVETLQQMENGLVDETVLDSRQSLLPTQDLRDTKTGDEEEFWDGREESEYQDEEIASATDARTVEEIRIEIEEVRRLVALARQVYNQKHESKFERLWEALEEYPDTKVLIFTEFRDTLAFLIDRLEGKGLTGKIAQIHGGMGYRERDQQADFFRDTGGARVMAATDAAGEGINLQFCWLLVNYDIPWNPARLEQRMGRVHRYKQKNPVLLLNMISKDTREGRVLKVLLEKLQNIRAELGSDKVFDVIGQQFTGKPLRDLIFEAVVEGKEQQAQQEIEHNLDKEQVEARMDSQARKVEVSEVRALLKALQEKRDQAEMRRMMPAYIRRFFQQAAPYVGLGMRGDIDGIFWLDPCPSNIEGALAAYPLEIRERLTFERELAVPELGGDPKAIYLHPGEPLFDAVMDSFLGECEHLGMRGAIYYDGEITEAYIFYLARSVVLRDQTSPGILAPEVVAEKVIGLRRFSDSKIELAPAHLLLTLFPSEPDLTDLANLSDLETDLWSFANNTTPVEAFVAEQVGLPALEARRHESEQRIPGEIERLRVAFNLRKGELYQQRRILKEAVENDVPVAKTKLRVCEEELSDLDRRRREAEAELYTRVDRLRLGPVSLYAQALVLPLPPDEVDRRQDVQAEQIALEEVIRREEAEGSVIEDVSAPHLKAGFDLKVLRADGKLRYIEVKGRSAQPAVELTENEWAQAANHRDKYWLYVVYNCETVPTLHRIPDPFGHFIVKQTGSVRINASDIIASAKPYEME